MQLRIWSEMLQGGIHSSLTDCPTSSTFVWAGGETGRSKDDSIAGIGEIVKEAAVAISLHFHHDHLFNHHREIHSEAVQQN